MSDNKKINTLKCDNTSSYSAPKEIEGIRLYLNDDWKVLRSIYDLLVDEKAFCVNKSEWNEKIVEFVQPADLKVSFSSL